jgi:hypothetical protein
MEKVREFRRRARECRVISAKASTPELQGHFREMAAIWDKLADERMTFFVEHPRERTGPSPSSTTQAPASTRSAT